MVGCLTALGAGIDTGWAVDGTGGELRPGPLTVDARMSGTTARFIAPVLGLGRGGTASSATPSWPLVPWGRPSTPSASSAPEVERGGEPGHLPVVGARVRRARRGLIAPPAHVSSQFLSGLLMAAPAMRRGRGSSSRPSWCRGLRRAHRAVMAAFGVEASPASRRRAARVPADPYDVEPDAVRGVVLLRRGRLTGGRVRVAGLGRRRAGRPPLRRRARPDGADVESATASSRSAAPATRGVTSTSATSPTPRRPSPRRPCASRPTTVTGVGFIRGKETDRIAAIVTELRRCGVEPRRSSTASSSARRRAARRGGASRPTTTTAWR